MLNHKKKSKSLRDLRLTLRFLWLRKKHKLSQKRTMRMKIVAGTL